MRSMSASGKSTVSQKTPAVSGAYTVRPSTCTRRFFAKRLLNPREATAHLLPSTLATLMPGTMRNSSGNAVAPERRICS